MNRYNRDTPCYNDPARGEPGRSASQDAAAALRHETPGLPGWCNRGCPGLIELRCSLLAKKGQALGIPQDTGQSATMFLEALFADASEGVRNGEIDHAAALEAAMEVVETYVPATLAVFGYGSAFTGDYLPYSDVDVVAVVERSASISNYCFMSLGLPIDLHVIGADSIERIIDHAEKSGVSSILSSIAGGEVLHDPQGLAAGLRETCGQALLKGPRPPLPRETAALRWMTTTQLIDIAQDRPMVEIRAAALSAYPMLLQLCAIGAGTWRDRGKWAVRRPDRSQESALIESFATLFAVGDKAPMIDAALAILDRVGGPLCFGQGNAINLAAVADREGPAPVSG